MSIKAILSGAEPPRPPKLLEQVRDAIRRKHYSLRTEDTYVHWIKRFIYFHGKRHARELGEAEVTAFLNDLARVRKVASATQHQALSAVLGMPLAWLDDLVRAKALHESDLASGHGDVEMPYSLARKYPKGAYEWGWKFVFPSRKLSVDPRSGVVRRHHVFDDVPGRAIKQATRRGWPANPRVGPILKDLF